MIALGCRRKMTDLILISSKKIYARQILMTGRPKEAALRIGELSPSVLRLRADKLNKDTNIEYVVITTA